MPFELEIEATPRESEFARRARDVAAVLAQGFSDHAAFEFLNRVGERHVLARSDCDCAERRDRRLRSRRGGHTSQFGRELVWREDHSVFCARDDALCVGGGQPVDDRIRVREVASLVAMCELAAELAGAVDEARVASAAYLDAVGTSELAASTSVVDAFVTEVEARYKLPLR